MHRSSTGYRPALLGAAAAAFQILTGVSTEAVAITVTVAASCYLAAAALGRRWVAWAGIPVASLVVTLGEVAGTSWWLALAALAGVLMLVGLATRQDPFDLTDQGLAMVVFGTVAVAALFVSADLGLALAGAALVGHAAWDYVYWRRDEVVPRSLSEFCMVLDVPFGMAAILLALSG